MSEEIKSKAFKRAELNIQKKLKNAFLNNYAHYTMPGINTIRDNPNISWDPDSVFGMFQEYPYNCDLPKPLLPPVRLKREVLSEEDPALQIITTKSYMKDDIDRLTQYYQKYENVFKIPKKKDVKWLKENKKNYTSLPKIVAEIAEIVELDPDPYFSGTYNWYYTGGTLTNICYGGENILLFPYSEELIATSLSSREGFLWKPRLESAANCNLDGVLYELRNNIANNFSRILGRYKNHCILYSLSGLKEKMLLIELHKQTSSIPYVSADLNPVSLNEYCTANVERVISKWDLMKVKCVSSGTIMKTKSLDDNWGSIRYQPSDPEVLIYVDRCCIHYIDTRGAFESPVLSLCPKNDLEACESLCFDCPSNNTFSRYVGTYHSCLLCDSRSPNQCTQQKWTHQFKDAPLFSSVVNKGSQEMVLLASHLPRESAIILNNWNDENRFQSSILPFTPPSILETLQQSRMQGKSLDPLMKLRLELSTVGCTLTTDGSGHTFLFLQNSIGDIFYQGLTHEASLNKFSMENCKALNALDAWENEILKQCDTVIPLAFSQKSNMKHVFENFVRRKSKFVRPEKSENLFDPSWKQPLTKLNSYVDILAPELLSIWEVTEESVAPITAVPHDKVLNWLETSEAQAACSQLASQSQDMEIESTPIYSQELISVSQQPDVEFLEEFDSIQQFYLPKVKSKAKPKESKKRKYVPGF
ncbi:uncharacterized protein LOC117169080 [Belonocnema kinseyi]|uniref:uncharacterized protein LOC117169080 n=1 Tax=Belonocnema kinseyi TaxID=2817044 RepID=UPI00143DC953|nr:uncharacterized protein LOC117169080 [Belonocnema kinseyi]